MSRIRSIHPGLWTDETFAALSDAALNFYFGLLNEADDAGIFEWKPVQLRMRLRPSKDGSVDPLLEELEAADVIRRFPLGGRLYGAIRNFCKYQRPKFPKFVHPTTSDIANYVASKALATPEEDSSTPLPTVATPVEPDPIPRNAEKSPQRERRREEVGGKGSLNLEERLKLDPEFGVSPALVASVIRGATRKMEQSNYVWLKDTDTRLPRAKAWWHEHYGADLPPQFRGRKQGYSVPWEAVQ
jgi:hypothetical protein